MQSSNEPQFGPQQVYFKAIVISAITTALLIIFEIYEFSNYYSRYNFAATIQSGEYVQPIKLLTLGVPSYILSALFLFCALVSPYRYRIGYFLFFSLSVLSEYSYQANFERFTVSEDLANILFAADERVIYNSAAQYFDPTSLLPCFAVGVLFILVKPAAKSGLKHLAFLLITFLGFFTFTAYFSSNWYPSTASNALFRTVTAFPINWYAGSLTMPALSTFYHTSRETIPIIATEKPSKNIVFIVDESVRADHLSLNGYSRKTTPSLDDLNQKGFVQNWGIAVSGTTCSVTSNNLLLTGVTELPDITGRIYQYPTIFQYAKAMGYKTHYIDGQMTYRWLGKSTDIQDFDEWTTPRELNQENWFDVDREIANRVRTITENSTGNFIWINKFGVHAPYFDSYPQSETVWQPVPANGSEFSLRWPARKSGLDINNYDNAVLYNSKSFFTALIGGSPPKDTYYVYTSDHGQNLGEDGKTLTHCSSTLYEAMVPLFIISQPGQMPAADTSYKASHANIFATLLDLIDYPEDRRRPYALSILKARGADSKQRYYFEGNLNSRFANSLNLFDK